MKYVIVKGIGFEDVIFKYRMNSIAKKGWKICNRGHKYRGSYCPYCWRKNKNKK